ncbi:hypothetical protein BKK79_28690 [Cupriavidus sp. USMAA2-4]|uniref:hypothetical protein n=1 Tax=Cupriavidus sp. USMAA2-4 TaxID=876364 RepID=UPI0008A6F14B|nr:hypothetical protein [Cupriavidus sp. USMAA2-4]AOY95693.1 hypothetical protein BKK79_28690 [Cupriavidus sp. USMAA2-4]
MSRPIQSIGAALGGAAVLALSACGGDGGTTTTTTSATPAAAATLSGTAATGSALANANVAVTDSSGNSPCQESSITTSAFGTYTCTLKAGEAAPFFIVVTDPTGNTQPLVSVSTTTPAAGAALTVNATPLTTAIAAQLAPDGNALTLVSGGTVDAAALKQTIANVVAQLSSVLAAIGAPAGYDPFTTAITAATASGAGNTADQLLDIVKVVKDPATGKAALATVDNPTPITLATATSAGGTLSAPAAGVASLPQAIQAVAQALSSCFALPASQRVLATDTTIPAAQGGPSVTSVAGACQNLTASSSNAAGVDFLHNGYQAGQFLFNTLTADSMTGARFGVPEVMAFYPAANSASGQDEAVLNIKYADGNGNPGNFITLARSIPNSATSAHASNWWLTGNQQPVDVSLKTLIRRVQQLNASNTGNFSRFQSGLQFSINAMGPGSVDGNGNPLNFARVTGPGLPSGGVVYVAPVAAESGQSYMDVSNTSGDITAILSALSATPPTAPLRCGNSPSASQPSYNCPNFWLYRTAGVSGGSATTLAANPANNSGITGNTVWAQSGDGSNPALVVKGTRYQVELFYGTSATPTYTYNKTLLTDLVQATQGVNLAWNTPGSTTLAALDPGNGGLNGAQASLSADWAQNAAAEQIGNVQVTVDTKGNWGASTPVPKGATSVVVNAAVPAFTTTTTRGFLFGYRMLDSSNKTAVYEYN